MKFATLLLLLVSTAFAQTRANRNSTSTGPGYCGGSSAAWTEIRSDLVSEIQDTQKFVAGMNARSLMLQSSSASIQNFTLRNIVQTDANMWQSLMSQMTVENQRRQKKLDRCDARANSAAAAHK